MDQILSVSGLTTSFRVDGAWKPVVRDLDFTIARGETVAIVGESGSGKSVTALSIMRLLQEGTSRIDGSVKLGDTELLALDEAAMRDVRGGEIGMIFQEPMTSLNPVLKIGFQIAEALRRHRGMSQAQAETEVLRLFDLVRIPDAKRRIGEYPHSFSGGMRQRAMIAMALACQPKLLIADEPTTALDVTIQAQILELVRELQQEIGMAVMFITHDMGVVAEISDKVVVMLRGDKVEEAPVADLFRAPRHSYTKMLLGAVPRLGGLGDTKTPRRFPKLDETGAGPEPGNEPDRRGEPILQVKNLTTRFTIRGGLLNRPVGNVHAVEDVSLELAAGETLALVGPSGAGKSTLFDLLLRFFDPQQGRILIDGVPIDQLDPRELRACFALVSQNPALFYGSVEDNIRYGRLDASQAEVEAAARAAHAHEFIQRLPQGYQTHLGEAGLGLSGGQRQRLAIARALLADAPILLLDEATSALDAESEHLIQQALPSLMAGRTTLVIAHRLATVKQADRIAVIERGRLAAIGRHAELIDSSALYARLAELQFGS